MSDVKNYKFHNTSQFDSVIRTVINKTRFKGIDEEGKAIYDNYIELPTLSYVSTVKLHGTNASIILHEDGVISFHSKEKLLGFVTPEGEFTLFRDNAEFAQTMSRRIDTIRNVMEEAKVACLGQHSELLYPIKVSGEWCGKGINNNVGINKLNKKSLFIFGVRVGDPDGKENNNKGIGWLSPDNDGVFDFYEGIYDIRDFQRRWINIDFSDPKMIQNELVEKTNLVEECCPVSNVLRSIGHLAAEENEELVGEGLVWRPEDPKYSHDSGFWFKTKGKKHSASKTRSVAPMDVEKLNSINEFVEYAATDNRLEQGITEVGRDDEGRLDIKLMGKYIGWVNRDINKEEGYTLESNNLSMKDVGGKISTTAREFYLNKINEMRNFKDAW